WTDFQLSDHFNHSWSEGEPGQWILLQFMDTDCPHCWREAEDMSNHWPVYGETGAVLYITISVEVVGSGHSKGEIVAFKEKQDFDGCKKDSNCKDRPGESHPWMYVNGLNSGAKDDYKLPGVPFDLLLSPDGIVAWNGVQHTTDGLDSADNAMRHHLMEGA
ncbi:MAG TPA: redoxin domain-containing protein, partial [Candidatus Poseidoniales archaeon]|nr:redoxin domain-containing protein [Candidatus Poseidoniales archaeon]